MCSEHRSQNSFVRSYSQRILYMPLFPLLYRQTSTYGFISKKVVEDSMKNLFQHWYSEQVMKEIKSEMLLKLMILFPPKIDLSLTAMKPLSAKWLVQTHKYLCRNPDFIKNGFKEAGITETVLKCTNSIG